MKEAGPGRSMANCITQRKPGPACSQPLRSGGAGLSPFRTRQNGSRSLKGPFQKLRKALRQNKRRNVIIGLDLRGLNCVGKQSWKSSLVLL